MKTSKLSKALLLPFVMGIVMALNASITIAQELSPTIQSLSRGKFWYTSFGNGIVEETSGAYNNRCAYPGYYGAQNIISGHVEAGAMWKMQGVEIDGTTVGRGIGEIIYAIKPNELHKNYNFLGEGGIENPEEWTEAINAYYPTNPQGQYVGKLQVETKNMVWSVPKYDDFIIQKIKLTNMDDKTFEDLYYVYPRRIGWGLGNVYTYDKEYEWDDDINGFIFYDDTSWPFQEAEPIKYLIPPGDEYGDRGDPGNITTEGSIDRKLYAPQVFCFNCVNVPPNKNGESKVWSLIFNGGGNEASASGVPDHEYIRWWNWPYADFIQYLQKGQEHQSWRDLWNNPNNPRDGSMDGNLYEREPFLLLAVGPYDLAPGESIEWIQLMVGGHMDLNVTQKGGVEAVKRFKDEGIANLKENYKAALELIENNFKLPQDAYPPPTVGLPPFVGTDEEILKVEAYSSPEEGSGFEISWLAVPDDYTDPGTGEADFAGYKLYRSEIGILGPWIEVADISKEEAKQYKQGDRIIMRIPSEPNIPYRFAATSYDTHGLESGMTAYSYYPVSVPPAPSNKLSNIQVVPNPFKQRSGFLDPGENNRLTFINIPSKCTIRIYTLAAELVRTIEHDGFGSETWGTAEDQSYMETDFGESVMPGLYIYQVESHVPGHEGETQVGKFMIIR